MNIIFVTGSDAAFFNSTLVGLRSFAERMPDQRLLVCDFGFDGAQAGFLRGLGMLLERPPMLESEGAFHCKAALLAYLRHNGQQIGPDDVVVWLDADLTLMDVGVADFAAVLTAMVSAGVAIAVCPEPLGRSFGQMLSGPMRPPWRHRPVSRRKPGWILRCLTCRAACFSAGPRRS